MPNGKASRKSTIWALWPSARSLRTSSRPAPSWPPPMLAETTRTRLPSTGGETTVPGGMVVASALGSALLYALASVLQQRAARVVPSEKSLRLSLLTTLLARPLWVVGVLADVGGFVLQFYALDHGALVLVQPLLVSGLLFALPLGAAFSKESMRPADWVGAGL